MNLNHNEKSKDFMTIPEGATVRFVLFAENFLVKEAIANEEIAVKEDTLVKIGNSIFCTHSLNPVRKMSDTEFEIHLWIQDTMIVNEGYLFSSASDLD